MVEKPVEYLVDLAGLAGEPESNRTRRQDEEGSPLGLHDTTLFDEGSSASGELYDPMTGEPYKNRDIYTETEGLTVVIPVRVIKVSLADLLQSLIDNGSVDPDEVLDTDIQREITDEISCDERFGDFYEDHEDASDQGYYPGDYDSEDIDVDGYPAEADY